MWNLATIPIPPAPGTVITVGIPPWMPGFTVFPDAAVQDPDAVAVPPARRPDLLLRPLGDRGRYVVKDLRTGVYFTLGEQEYFLLCQLDGVRSAGAICRAFEEQFGEPLSRADLDGFVELARSRRFLLEADETPGARSEIPGPVPEQTPATPSDGKGATLATRP